MAQLTTRMDTMIADFLDRISFHHLIAAGRYHALNVPTANKLQCLVCAHVLHLHGPCCTGCLHADCVLYRCEECCELMDQFGSTHAGASIFYENHIHGQYVSAIMVPSFWCDICAPMAASHACNFISPSRTHARYACALCMQNAVRPRTAYQTQTDYERWRFTLQHHLI